MNKLETVCNYIGAVAIGAAIILCMYGVYACLSGGMYN